MVVRAGKTRYAMVDKLLETLPRERMLGVVLNRVDEHLESNSYYYQQRYYRRPDSMPGEEQGFDVENEEEVAIAS
jgi:Mrp family chromosome partitioning ATPase